MIEQEYLKYCLEKIEESLGWKPSAAWKESDFIKLSEIITQKANISISSHTLKRLFGKIKYKKYYNPQQATKDALAKFLEYSDWEAFVFSIKKEKQVTTAKLKSKHKLQKPLVLVIVGVLIVLLGVFLFGNNKNKPLKDTFFKFSLADSVGIVPYTVSVNYNLKDVKFDSTFIDFGFNHPIKGNQTVLLDKNEFMRNFTYQIPGQYVIKLKSEGKNVVKKKVLAKSDGWESFFNPEIAIGDYWLDNKIPKSAMLNNLYYAPKYLDSVGFNTNQVYYLSNRFYNEFNIDGDNFELNAKFKNSEDLGGITCFDFIIRIICENETNNIKLMENGCSQFSGMKIGETVLSGVNKDLSAFKFNLNTWNYLKIKTNNRFAQVYINRNKIFEGSYTKPNGNIVGLEIIFKGSGMLDNLRLKDLKTNKKYISSFK